MTDPYLDGRWVLRNLLGIADAERLQQAEADFTKLRLFELEQGSAVNGAFDSNHLRALHRSLFQDIYAWAGLTRGDEIELGGRRIVSPALLIKGQTKFETSPRVNASLERVLESVAERGLRGLSVAEFSRRSADLLTDLNRVHPFREGNGRTQRVFLSLLARDAGHPLVWDVVSQERMIAAITRCSRGERAPMRRLIAEITNTARSNALRDAIWFLEREEINWNERYLATAETGQAYEGVIAAGGSRHSMVFSSDEKIIVALTEDLGDAQAGGVSFTAHGSIG